MAQIFERTSDLTQLVGPLFKELKSLFPIDHLMLARPIDSNNEFPHQVYPDLRGRNLIKMNVTNEQRQVILQGESGMLIRSGNHEDYAVTIHRIKELAPGMPFSILFLRYVIKRRYIANMVLLSKTQNAFTEEHAAWLFILGDLFTAFWNALSLEVDEPDLPGRAVGSLELDKLPGMQGVLEKVWSVSRQECPVLLRGETGTGKEVVANALYRGSARQNAPFIKVNCGSIPDTLIESELFGHEKGAFTSAVSTVKGRFERADRGVLLLDELGELPGMAQTRLLRVLQEGVIERVGGERELHVDVRIVAATHRNLSELVQQGRFRQDLFYRLNVFPIHIPPLRERPEDIPLLLNFFLYRKCIQEGFLDVPKISKAELDYLRAYAWPGNIRELQNVVERAVILWGGRKRNKFEIVLDTTSIFNRPLPFPENANGNHMPSSLSIEQRNGTEPCSLLLDDVISRHISSVIGMTKGRISGKKGAAALLGLNASTLRAKMKKLGLS